MAGASGGAAAGLVMGATGNPWAAGATYGAVSDGVQQTWDFVASGGDHGADPGELAENTVAGGITGGLLSKIAGPVAAKLRSSPLGDLFKSLTDKIGDIKIGGFNLDNRFIRVGDGQISNRLIPLSDWATTSTKGNPPLPGGKTPITRISIFGVGFPISIHIDSRNWFQPWAWLTRIGSSTALPPSPNMLPLLYPGRRRE